MKSGYDPQAIEAAWQERWEKDGVYHAEDPSTSRREKFYGLIEFPYPSGEGLHVGHPRSYTAIDILTRKKRMEGKNVLYPIGWDAFGLPTENFAIKHKVKPQDATKKNIATFTRQLTSLGFGFDWSREIDTTDPSYYRWTQWMFLKLFGSYYDTKKGRARPIEELPVEERDGRRMAYKASATINWCPSCKIGLANEEAQGGECERCGALVEKREKAQWMIRITAYAERLLEDLKTVDYLERIRTQQEHWIGRSEGAFVDFVVGADTVRVFTTRPDTLFGATYLVLSPEHPMVDRRIQDGLITNGKEIEKYREQARRKSDIERQENREKTGVELKGLRATNPATGEDIPLWISDYVLATYGTGAIMAVPAHDDRDFAFATKFTLPIKEVVRRPDGVEQDGCWTGEGVNVDSGFLDGLTTAEATKKMIAWLEKEKKGKGTVTYKLRDWVFSRQRYWGEPIPIVFCDACGTVPVPEDQLPVVLPDVEKYEPTDTGESPLAKIDAWVDTTCPTCGKPAKRETDTMPNWAGSSWYFLRYCDPHNDAAFADPKKLEYWMPVDLYNGGMEHTTLHLLYSRFWYKFLWDLGLVPKACGPEPYKARRSHALILGEGGVKMSKSKGNVVNPDDVVAEYGADVFRMYEMFIGPFDQDAPWDTRGIEGVRRFLEKVWRALSVIPAHSTSSGQAPAGNQKTGLDSRLRGNDKQKELETLLHQTIKKVGDDIESLNFNTAVSALMILANAMADAEALSVETREAFLKLLAPFAPHMTEELWHRMGHETSIHVEPWPTYDPKKIVASTFELVVQVNGKVRDRLTVDADISEKEATAKALASEKVTPYLEGKTPKKIVYVKGRLVGISV
ncbi:leucine--tRNA ligase [Candidatus Uhrbacteria bacterium]|nr:leucine--tRNA ligase [Candidatus Uhrbacteria bacterium]